MEIAVTFSSAVCNKTTVTHYLGKTVFLSCGVCHSLHIYSAVEGVLTSVSLRSRTLVIESRDCIASPENYTLIIMATPTSPVNVSFNTTVEYKLEDVVNLSTIGVKLVEKESGATIDEKNYTIMSPTPDTTPTLTPTKPSWFHICDRVRENQAFGQKIFFSSFHTLHLNLPSLYRPRKFQLDRPFCFRAIDTFVWVIRVCGIAQTAIFVGVCTNEIISVYLLRYTRL